MPVRECHERSLVVESIGERGTSVLRVIPPKSSGDSHPPLANLYHECSLKPTRTT